MSETIVNSTIVVNDNVDNGGRVFRRGSAFTGVLFSVKHGTLYDTVLDDGNLVNQTGVAILSGDDTSFDGVTLNNCQRYGLMTGAGINRWVIRNCTINKAQHGISGTSSSDGSWSPNYDGLVENNVIRGYIIHGVKAKNWVRATVRGNQVDCAPISPGYIGSSTTYSKEGICFGAADASNIDCVIEANTIFKSFSVAGIDSYGVIAYKDHVASVNKSTGNRIVSNIIKDVNRGITLQGNNYYVGGNSFTNVRYPIIDQGLNNVLDSVIPIPPPPVTPPPVTPPPVTPPPVTPPPVTPPPVTPPPVTPPPVTPPPVTPPTLPPGAKKPSWIPIIIGGTIIYILAEEVLSG